MAAKKKTLQETRKEYVQAKIATNSASKNPAKLRQEFNTKAATVKGRTEIVQTLGVAGTPQAQMLRATLRNFPTTSTGNASTGAASTNKSKPVVTTGYGPGIANNVNMPSNNSASSAVVSSTSKYGVNLTPITGKVSESIGFYGKDYDTSGRKTLSLPKPKTPVIRNSMDSLRGMQGTGSFNVDQKQALTRSLQVLGVVMGASGGLGAPSYYQNLEKTLKIKETAKATRDAKKAALNFYKNLNK